MATTASLFDPQAIAAHYREQGYAVVRGVFAAETIARASAAAERLREWGMQHGRFRHGHVHSNLAEDEQIGLTVRSMFWVGMMEPVLHDMIRHPRILDVLRPLIGENIKQLTNQIHYKPSGSRISVNFHTDRANRVPAEGFRNLGDSFVQIGMAIDPMVADNGPLLVIPGSHRRVDSLVSEQGNYADGHPSRDILAQRGYSEADLLALEAEAGDIVLWHPDTIHGSDQNTHATLDRRLYISGFIDARATLDGYFAWIKGQAIPLPDPAVPAFMRNFHRDPNKFPWEYESWPAYTPSS